MKPGDAFLGVIDFFSTLVPGAVAAFLLLNQDLLSLPSGWPLKWASTEGWAVFVVSAYLLGHGIAAASSLLLDGPVYDRIYVRWKRTKYVRWPMKGRANVCRERADVSQHCGDRARNDRLAAFPYMESYRHFVLVLLPFSLALL